jgi:hypothetical protein
VTDTGEIARWIAAINDHPDAAHGDFTPAVHALIDAGLPALEAVLPLLLSDDQWTRLRAQRVLEGVTRDWVRQHAAAAHPVSLSSERAWQALWQDNGSYDWRAGSEARSDTVARWQRWLEGIMRHGR